MGNARKAKGAKLQLFGRFCAWGMRRSFSLPGKTGARCGHAPGTSRVRARLGAGKNTVRDLPGAAALEKPRSKAQLFKRFCALGERVAPRFTYSWKFGAGFCPAAGNRNQAFSLPGKTGARCGPTPRKNRVRARHGEERDTERELPTAGAGARRGARTRNQPRACETRGRKRHGARLARRRRATCPAQPRRRAVTLLSPASFLKKA